jgi:hypothetical protein
MEDRIEKGLECMAPRGPEDSKRSLLGRRDLCNLKQERFLAEQELG